MYTLEITWRHSCVMSVIGVTGLNMAISMANRFRDDPNMILARVRRNDADRGRYAYSTKNAL